ncbi:protein ALP1-like [Aphis craccivora]|uniref:Protein ALP1-like n=1 Tax=Aphis craccivora TaxID=307492 RepID=A0A6G0XZX3_APHCR|nr:protein ALP1-like [Aphis craccivora]
MLCFVNIFQDFLKKLLKMDYNYYINALRVISVADSYRNGSLISTLTSENTLKSFFEYYRMSITSFDELLEQLRPHITKKITTFRNPISAEERLTLTIRYLSTGTNFVALQYEFFLGRSTIGTIIQETC